MKNKIMDTLKLIDALKNGKILCKKHHDDDKCLEFIFQAEYNGIRNLELKGWGTAFGDGSDRLFELYQYPENWKIVKDFNMNTDEYPYPWSSLEKIEVNFE